ncbi:MAG: TIGR01212 family radical SAM protein [Deltaproteobacteria bacterium]
MKDRLSKPYNPLSGYLKERFGCKVYKVTVDAGFTCPNRDGTKGSLGCVYCNAEALVPRDYAGAVDIGAQLRLGINKVRQRHKAEKFIAYFQMNTNTHGSVDQLRSIYAGALIPEVAGVAISTRPDCLSDEVIGILSEIKSTRPVWLELGLQSSNDATLLLINRRHSVADFSSAVARAHLAGIDVCAHIIIGLPGEGRTEALSTVRFVADLDIWGVKFHQLQVLKDTALEAAYLNGGLDILELEEYSSIVVDSLELLSPSMVIHRLSGDAPRRFIVAPDWGVNKFIIDEMIVDMMRKRNTRQGARYGL